MHQLIHSLDPLQADRELPRCALSAFPALWHPKTLNIHCENEEATTAMLDSVSNTFKSQCKMNKKIRYHGTLMILALT